MHEIVYISNHLCSFEHNGHFSKVTDPSGRLFCLTMELLTMSRAEVQESAEYYKWLLRIERIEFEKELLEIVSSHTCQLHT